MRTVRSIGTGPTAAPRGRTPAFASNCCNLSRRHTTCPLSGRRPLRPVIKEAIMFRSAAALIAVLLVGGVDRVDAQESAPGPGTVEVTVIPGGATFFTNKGNGPSFGNYNLGGALTYNINRIVGIEGEVSSSIGISQNLTDGGFSGK